MARVELLVSKTIEIVNRHGIVQPAQQTLGTVTTAIGYDGKVLGISSVSDVLRYKGGQWDRLVDNSVDLVFKDDDDEAVLSELPSCLFLASSGTILLSFIFSNAIFRSDDDGETWTRPLEFITEGAVNTSNRADNIAEADNGWLFVPQYHQKSPTAKDVHLWRSKDDGVTWEDLATKTVFDSDDNNLGTVTDRVQAHIHGMFWDKYRNHLYVSHGDSSSLDNVFVSDDYGDTFYEIETIQMVGIAFTENSGFLTGDENGNRRIFKLDLSSVTTAKQVAALTPAETLDPTDPPFNKATQNDMGFAWMGYYDGTHVIFPYGEGSVAAVTADDGETWQKFVDTDGAGRIEVARGIVSPYYTEWDGSLYWNPVDYFLHEISFHTDTTTISYDDGLSQPEIDALVAAAEASLESSLHAEFDYVSIADDYVTYTPSTVEEFDDVLGLGTSTTGAATAAISADQSVTGANSGKLSLAAGEEAFFTETVSHSNNGDVLTMEAWVRTTTDMNSGTLFTLKGASTVIAVSLDTLIPEVAFNLPGANNQAYRQNVIDPLESPVELTANTWHHVRWDVRLHISAGWFSLAIDGELAVESIGIPTLGASNITELKWGVTTSSAPLIMYLDSCKSGVRSAFIGETPAEIGLSIDRAVGFEGYVDNPGSGAGTGNKKNSIFGTNLRPKDTPTFPREYPAVAGNTVEEGRVYASVTIVTTKSITIGISEMSTGDLVAGSELTIPVTAANAGEVDILREYIVAYPSPIALVEGETYRPVLVATQSSVPELGDMFPDSSQASDTDAADTAGLLNAKFTDDGDNSKDLMFWFPVVTRSTPLVGPLSGSMVPPLVESMIG